MFHELKDCDLEAVTAGKDLVGEARQTVRDANRAVNAASSAFQQTNTEARAAIGGLQGQLKEALGT